MRRLKDENPESETQRLSSTSPLSSSSSHLATLSKGDTELPPEPSTRNDLARIAPFTLEAVVRICIVEARTTKRGIEGAAREGSLSMES